MAERPLQTPQWWLSHLRSVVASYGRKSATFALWADLAREDGYEPPAKLSGGARRSRARPARDALLLGRKTGDTETADWWHEQVETFMDLAAKDTRSLRITKTPKAAALFDAYREWLGVVQDSIEAVFIGNYDEPRLERAMRESAGEIETTWTWTGKYLLLIPKGHQAEKDGAARRALIVDLAYTKLPDYRVTSRDVRNIRRRARP